MSENTLLYYLKKSEEFLQKKGISSPRVDAEWILADLLGLSRIQLYAKFDMPLSQKEILDYREKIVERGKNKPVAYITGKKGFHKFDFFVNEHTLIPRPETEDLVEYIYKNWNGISIDFLDQTSVHVWDLCCGSGNIGISLTKLVPNIQMILSDLSPDALEVTKKNIQNHNVEDRTQCYVSNLGDGIPRELKFDLVVTNPPYIPVSEKEDLMPDVLNYEPHLALFIENFLEFHKEILSVILNRLKPGGSFFMETHPDYIHDLEKLAKDFGFVSTEILKDSSDKNRFLSAKKDN
ncbi:MAG: peptide chain release factor N(5)-glutamine methyltransferase [Leptospira sp.]|nr:peptide chain release factor N(5)-glutamine methyltransferase [Leptospira sp.]